MDPKTVKKLEQILDKKLEPISRKLDGHETQLNSIGAKLDEHSQKLDSLTLDMADVQKKTDAIADIRSLLVDTKTQIDDHEERITSLEAA